MPRFTSLLKLKKNTSLTEENLEKRCAKCGKRPATDQEGLCNHCRFDDVLTRLVETR